MLHGARAHASQFCARGVLCHAASAGSSSLDDPYAPRPARAGPAEAPPPSAGAALGPAPPVEPPWDNAGAGGARVASPAAWFPPCPTPGWAAGPAGRTTAATFGRGCTTTRGTFAGGADGRAGGWRASSAAAASPPFPAPRFPHVSSSSRRCSTRPAPGCLNAWRTSASSSSSRWSSACWASSSACLRLRAITSSRLARLLR
mmetsp:Transcript_21464/g.72220  ORF Transcript_21464/g.72220 Transcript_21464/m.72220 type:complete len:202 (+) Transcript_21464:122-727(+)